MTIVRNLLLICPALLFCCVTITNGNCEDTPADCVWNSQQKTYTCDIIGIPNDVITRRLQLSHLKISGSIYNVSTNPEMKDIGISWNKKYITLSFQKGSQSSETYLLSISSIIFTRICVPFCKTVSHKQTTSAQVTVRPLDVQLVNLTEIIHSEEDYEVILQCSIVGLNDDETDYDIMFYSLPKCSYNQKVLLGEINSSYIVNNGTICELHLPKANASHSGNYSCKVKVHRGEPEECVLVETPRMTVDIQATNTPTSTDNHTNIPATISGSVLGVAVFVLSIVLFIVWKKTRKQQEQTQQQQPQPKEQRPPVDEPEAKEPLNPEPGKPQYGAIGGQKLSGSHNSREVPGGPKLHVSSSGETETPISYNVDNENNN